MKTTGTRKPNRPLALVCLAGLAGIFLLSRHWHMEGVFLSVLLLTGFVILRNTGRLQRLLGKLETLFTPAEFRTMASAPKNPSADFPATGMEASSTPKT